MKWRIGVYGAVAVSVAIAGCAQLGYYVQAAQGQLALISSARPIDDWLADPAVEDTLKGRLARVKEIRRFAAVELGLPDNDTFTTYADLQRPYVMWNVVATPALSLKTKQWCFPIAGCVSYRGYYSKQEAQTYAEQLRRQNYDVQVGGVPAYSTLGWFSDPVLSTFVRYHEAELARLIFHELAHQVVYAPGDSRFNESFAVAVEEAGVERWIERHGDDKMRAHFQEHTQRKREFLAMLLKCRDALEANYAADTSDQEKLRRKAEIFQSLQDDYRLAKERWGGYAGYDRWFAEPLSNAHLAAVATYHDYVPGFRAMLANGKGFADFYASVRALAALAPDARRDKLLALAPPTDAAPAVAQTAAAAQ